MNKRPILIVDGLNVFIKFFLVNETISSKSEPIGGIVGFIKHIDMLMALYSPSKIIVVWENGGGSPRRKHIFPEYKAQRAKLFKSNTTIKDNIRYDKEAKIKQLSTLYQILSKTPICQIFIKETECDDIIGYLIRAHYLNEDVEKIIVSADKDFYQLLDDKTVKIYDHSRKLLIDEEYVKKTYEVSARNFCLAKTFNGDESDNIPGVPGVGFKTLSKRFPELLSDETDVTIGDIIEGAKRLLNNGGNKKLKSIQEIINSEELLKRNWKLMYLNTSNLSASQIEKVNGILEQHEPVLDSLGFLKEVSKAGINISFDFNKFSFSLKKCLIFR